jgi:two-component system, chemotaxis family, chemotaxis protein CheY
MHKLLLVDDDRTLLDMYQEFLSYNNNQVDTAINGPEGLAKAAATTYDVILLDVMMPNMDGMQVLAALKKNPHTAAMPVLFLSNVADEKYIIASRANGAAGYIVKTDFDLEEILQQIEQVIEKYSSSPPPVNRPNDK